MIVNLTAEDREQLKALENDFDQKLAEVDALIEKLAPAKDFDEKKERELQKKRPKRPKPIGKADDGSPVYDEEAFHAWEVENNKIDAEIDKMFNDWLSSGSQEWRDARSERIRLMTQKSSAFSDYYKSVERREFSKLGGDREKIVQSARDQIVLLIDNRFNSYQKMISTHKNENGEEISGFSGHDLRVCKDQIFLDSQTIVGDCKSSLLRLHFEALKDDPEATKIINDMIFEIVANSPKTSSEKGKLGATFDFKKRRSAKKLPTFNENADQDFFMFSTTQAKDIFFNLLSTDGDAKKTAKMSKAVGHPKKAQAFSGTTKSGDNSKSVMIETSNSLVSVELLNCQKVSGRPAKKYLHFIESELYQRTFYKGKMNSDVVTFPLQKLVDKKVYTSVQNARRAFRDASDALTALRVSATVKAGRKEVTTGNEGRVVLFPTMMIKDGQCFVRLNRDIDWSPLLKDFFLMPDSWWALPDNASDLEYKIFRMIRMNKEEISESGSLTINVSLSSVATWLDLPLETKNPKRDVKDPIETAVKQIAGSLDPNNFKIEIKTDLNASLSQYLTGYLEITIGGMYTQNLIDMNEKQQARVERATRRKEAIIKEATIRKIADQMKEEDQKSAT